MYSSRQRATMCLPASYVRTQNFIMALKAMKKFNQYSNSRLAFLLSLCGDNGFDSNGFESGIIASVKYVYNSIVTVNRELHQHPCNMSRMADCFCRSLLIFTS